MTMSAQALIQKHWAILLSSVFLLLLILLGNPLKTGWAWDLANGLGYAATLCLLSLCLASPNRYPVRAHQLLSYMLALFVVLHILLLWWSEPLTLEYIKPLAPVYMWAGVMALVLMLILILSSLPSLRMHVFHSREGYRFWHKGLSWLCVATTLYHLSGSGLYFSQWIYGALLPLLAVYCLKPFGLYRLVVHPWWQPMSLLLLLTFLFGLVREFSL
ncbi:hypothetical protein HBA55_23615 [Pseudomaricurvus alkylphenolicus]|uniref:hypothetical protein n=1 Tax=Pseudomaricurvus alkylphenolicus TaxID=1306991 RepID=UPI0014248638|nr:hypothetical protein [Pseudomaricurvus alkylphenolicus]NIB42616.1 hypothetical protein [Pseudomaricurvus alkylphenolicus]